MKDHNYILVSGWMVKVLKLSGNELLTFALIYGFCQDESSKFTGSLSYIMDWLNCSKPTVIKALKGLIEKNLILKESESKNGVTFNSYTINLLVVKKLYFDSKESLLNGSKETLPNNTNFDNPNLINNGGENPLLFPEFYQEAKTLFKNSIVGNEITFKQQFNKPEFDNIDVNYYFEAVKDWNEIKKVKRTAAGWIATAKGFMRRDLQKNVLKRIDEGKSMTESQFDYLKL